VGEPLPPGRIASLLLVGAGVPIKVSERLGHADPALTMRVYQHVLPGMQAKAAAAFAALLAGDSPSEGLWETPPVSTAVSSVPARTSRSGADRAVRISTPQPD
jgi:hypothetical protein